MRRLTALAAAIAIIGAAPAHAADPITGQWLTAKGNAVVTISKCGANACGRISRLLVTTPENPDGLDRRNGKPELRTRKLVGLMIIPNFTDAGKDWRGRIYSPETGGEYSGYLSRNADGTLTVKGCVAALLCQTQTWKPAK
ncbi:DUF2147 domain-containing protein [Sphingomonas sp. GlSt437]|uniref:DUF2147 domain-containing protein n=1 Tax=Sphingomonas sp. GlSt437 TaxID=3389970 RepID=UPI003A852773